MVKNGPIPFGTHRGRPRIAGHIMFHGAKRPAISASLALGGAAASPGCAVLGPQRLLLFRLQPSALRLLLQLRHVRRRHLLRRWEIQEEALPLGAVTHVRLMRQRPSHPPARIIMRLRSFVFVLRVEIPQVDLLLPACFPEIDRRILQKPDNYL